MTIRSKLTSTLAALVIPAMLLCSASGAAAADVAKPAPAIASPAPGMTRYMVTRTFPAGALAGLDAAGEAAVNKVNAAYSVRWVYSYANPAKTRTYCIYEAPSQRAVRDAAKANKLPVDEIVEIPNVIGVH
jgi:hypothetical protein